MIEQNPQKRVFSMHLVYANKLPPPPSANWGMNPMIRVDFITYSKTCLHHDHFDRLHIDVAVILVKFIIWLNITSGAHLWIMYMGSPAEFVLGKIHVRITGTAPPAINILLQKGSITQFLLCSVLFVREGNVSWFCGNVSQHSLSGEFCCNMGCPFSSFLGIYFHKINHAYGCHGNKY